MSSKDIEALIGMIIGIPLILFMIWEIKKNAKQYYKDKEER